ncbi:uncharacterized protein PgNI_00677 [Pyricularia grisea]|uniref:Uncharacterized protein n=1 Tax=Pyricularia grisea TaxID=148305 RepID=A0A6P8BLV1_PYRGI|nr:uncharacterized protein PgNI_00677 [Pyricularia grisea]TLD17856.1 hypothetical protein PgNI_00677 [Pyricularia grisea]
MDRLLRRPALVRKRNGHVISPETSQRRATSRSEQVPKVDDHEHVPTGGCGRHCSRDPIRLEPGLPKRPALAAEAGLGASGADDAAGRDGVGCLQVPDDAGGQLREAVLRVLDDGRDAPNRVAGLHHDGARPVPVRGGSQLRGELVKAQRHRRPVKADLVGKGARRAAVSGHRHGLDLNLVADWEVLAALEGVGRRCDGQVQEGDESGC